MNLNDKIKEFFVHIRAFIKINYLCLFQQNKPIAICVGFSKWKKKFIKDFFPEYKLYYISQKIKLKKYKKFFINKNFIIWSYLEKENIKNFLTENNINPIRVEDGFLRSKKLGLFKTRPLSLNIDHKACHFNYNIPSELENLLNTYEINNEEKKYARILMNKIINNNISKYNTFDNTSSILFDKKYENILVIGQVESDSSMKYGMNHIMTNNELVQLVYQENPNAKIYYKIHPDLLSGKIKKEKIYSNINEIQNICYIIEQNIPQNILFSNVSKVYTMTSLMGFEALLRNLKVVCLGCPFYSNWGLTEDRLINNRRKKKLTIEELFFISYVLYPKYINANGKNINIDQILEIITI